MSPEERRHYNNGIWLCKNCAREIDRDEQRFTVALLNKWKCAAEKASAAELGQRLPSEADIREQVHQIVTSSGTRYVKSALSNAIAVATRQLEEMDPRFRVTAEYREGREHFFLDPVSSVSLNMIAPPERAAELTEKFRALELHGETAHFSSDSLQWHGSPLMSHIFSEKGEITVAPARQWEATIRLTMTAEGSACCALEARGHLVSGTQTVRAHGYGPQNIFSVVVQCPLRASSKRVLTTNIGYKLESWEGKPLLRLPYFERLYQFTTAAANGARLTVELDVDGNLASSSATSVSADPYWQELAHYLRFLDYLRTIANYTGAQPVYSTDIEFTSSDYSFVEDLALALRQNGVHETAVEEQDYKWTLNLGSELADISTSEVPRIVRYAPVSPAEVHVGSLSLELPMFHKEYFNALLLNGETLKSAKAGDEVTLTWRIKNGCVRTTILKESEGLAS